MAGDSRMSEETVFYIMAGLIGVGFVVFWAYQKQCDRGYVWDRVAKRCVPVFG